MSYDIYLKDPVTGKTAEVPDHLMCGGTYKADYHLESGTFTPALNTEADLNIKYNYGHYYHEINAIKPLYQLLALAKMRPDCIWDGD